MKGHRPPSSSIPVAASLTASAINCTGVVTSACGCPAWSFASLEGVIGFSFALLKARIALAVQPFYVVAQGVISTLPCAFCEPLRVDSLDASWGAAFTLTRRNSLVEASKSTPNTHGVHRTNA
jgi:hypothetical protein